MTETETMVGSNTSNGIVTANAEAKPGPAKAKGKATKRRTASTAGRKTKKAAAASKKKTKAKTRKPRHWTAKHAQLVLHATPQLVGKLDRSLNRLAIKLKCKASRGSVIRALVEKSTK